MKKFLLKPTYWPLIIVYPVARLIALLPYSLLMSCGALLGHIGYYLIKERKQIIATNIKLCFPNLSASEQKKLVKANIVSTSQSLFETILAYFASDKKLKNLIEIEGLEHLEKALSEKQGVILLTAHFTMLDLTFRLLNMTLKTPVAMMYRQHNHPVFEDIIRKNRLKHCKKLIRKKEIGKLYQALSCNVAVWYAPDQNFSYHNVFAPFFGVKAATVTGTSRIARESGAKVVPFFVYRKANNKGYYLQLQPALENFPSGNDYEDTARINLLIENAIREHPEQYLWSHRRFKTRPPGEPLIYPKKKKRV